MLISFFLIMLPFYAWYCISILEHLNLNGVCYTSYTDASITLKSTMNEVDLVDRTNNIVRKDVPTVDISGDKTFSKATSLNTIRVKDIHTGPHGTGSYDKTYQVDDFVNTKNAQSLSSGKTFAGLVTLGDLKFIGSSANINDKKIASLQNCWMDTSSSTDVIDVTRKVSFENLITPGFQAYKKGKGSPQ